MNCSRFGFLVTSLFVITSLFARRVLCTQYLESVEVDSSVPLTHHDPKDLGLICLVKQRNIRFRILSDFRIHSWIFFKKGTLKDATGDLRLRSAEDMFSGLRPCNFFFKIFHAPPPYPHHAPFNKNGMGRPNPLCFLSH